MAKTNFKDAANRVLLKRKLSIYQKPIYAVWELFSDFSKTSTLHGVRYIGEKRRHWVERLFWVAAFFCSVAFCTHSIFGLWIKWQEFPVIVSYAEKTTPVWDIPFPAITICSDIKISRKRFNYTDLYFKEKLSDSEMMYMRSFGRICGGPRKNVNYSLEENFEPNDSKIYNHISEALPHFRHTFLNCKWRDVDVKCWKYFSKIWTEEGICYTFNSYNSSELYNEKIFNKNVRLIHHNNTDRIFLETNESHLDKNTSISNVYPLRVASSTDSLEVVLRIFKDDREFLCSNVIQSFKVLFHTSGEIPQVSRYFYRVSLNTAVFISVKPNIMTTTPSLGAYDYEQRQCYFETERKLLYFKKYTQRNCDYECIVNNTIRLCGCTPFGMPRSKNFKLCRMNRNVTACINKAVRVRRDFNNKDKCNCLPSCNSVTYDAELSHAKYDLTKYSIARKNQIINSKFVKLTISYKENQFITSRRSELYGVVDFMSNFGGLLSLFLGFSFISIVEFIYYCTLRLGCNFRAREIKRKKARAAAIALGIISE